MPRPRKAKNKKVIGVNMKQEMADELEDRAASMQLSASKYCQIILIKHLESGQKLKLEEK